MQPVQVRSMISLAVIRNYTGNHEGLSLKAYLDSVGKWTIGIGRNLDDVGISKEEAEMLFVNDVRRTLSDLASVFTDTEFNKYPDNVQLVLIDMMFQLGLTRFCTFKKMIAKVKALDFKGAADEILDSRYASQVPARAKENAERMSS